MAARTPGVPPAAWGTVSSYLQRRRAGAVGRRPRRRRRIRAEGGGPMPQEAWSDKRERQYEHIKESYEERGKSEEKAEELAARTVNKTRAEKGETKQQRDDD
jgi:hypothetical protein